MSSLKQARAMALALPEVTEANHHGIASFRVGGKIFATAPDGDHLRIMVDEAEIRAAVAENPSICNEFYWGKRLACVAVDLKLASANLVRELLTEAWLRKAPHSLAARFPGGS